MPAVEILNPITDGAEFLQPGDIVQEPSPRLLALAKPGTLHLGLQIARFYDADVTARELHDKEVALAVPVPPLDRVREAAAAHGYEILLKGSEQQFANLAEDLQRQLFIAQECIAELRLQLEEQAKAALASADPEQVDNSAMLGALSSTEAEAPVEGGDLAEAAAPSEDSPKGKKGK